MKLFDNSNDRKYFTMIPNMIDDMGLSMPAIRVYLHLKRVAGESGECWQSTNTIAKRCGIGMATVSKAKKELLENGLIEITKMKSSRGKNSHTISIVDVWSENIKKCSENSITSVGEVIDSVITSVGEVNNFARRNKEEPLIKKNQLKENMAEESAGDDKNDLKTEESVISQYPPRYQEVVQKFSEYFCIDPPGKKERDFRTWITGADAFVKACGKRDPLKVMETIYQKWEKKPYTVTDLYSIVKMARIKEPEKKPVNIIQAPEGWDGK